MKIIWISDFNQIQIDWPVNQLILIMNNEWNTSAIRLRISIDDVIDLENMIYMETVKTR